MAIHLENVGTMAEGEPFSWDSKDALLYALSVGAGSRNQLEELAFTTENSRGIEQQVLPTFAVVLGASGGSMEELGDFSLSQILHGGQTIRLQRTLATSGTVIPVSGMSAVYDKGKNAVIELSTDLFEVGTRDLVATSITTMIIRGEGGFGGESGPAETWSVPDRSPDAIVTEPTRRDQALLYRLNGDRNPLHSDPAMAQMVGFDKPILHGLCTMGFAGRAVLEQVADSEPDDFGSLSVRFASPVIPGDELSTRIWTTDSGALFQVCVGSTVVLDRGTYTRR